MLSTANGDKLRQTLGQLSGVARILANGSGNIVDIIKNLQTFVGALRDSNVQIVQFNDRLATLTSVVNDSKSDLDAALTDLSTAVGEVQRFIAGTRNQTSEQIARLADVTQNLVDHHMALENILHGAPNALGNFFNDYNADTGTIVGGFGLMNFANPTWGGQLLLSAPGCDQIGAIENVTAVESGKLCALFLGPGLRLLNFNNSPLPINPFCRSRSTRPRFSTPNRAWHPAARARNPDHPRSRPRCRPTPACRVIRWGRRGRCHWRGYRVRRCRCRPHRRHRCHHHRRRRACRACCCRQKGHSNDRPGCGSAGVRRRLLRGVDVDGMRIPRPEFTATARCGRTRAGGQHLPRRAAECRDDGVEFAGDDRRRRRRQCRHDAGARLARRRRDLGQARCRRPGQRGSHRRSDQPAGLDACGAQYAARASREADGCSRVPPSR